MLITADDRQLAFHEWSSRLHRVRRRYIKWHFVHETALLKCPPPSTMNACRTAGIIKLGLVCFALVASKCLNEYWHEFRPKASSLCSAENYYFKCNTTMQSLKKIAILRRAIFAQILPFRAKSQFFANFALAHNFCANLWPCGAQFFAKFANFAICAQFARRYLTFSH